MEVLEDKKNRVKNNEGQADGKKGAGKGQHIEEKKEERINNNYKTLFQKPRRNQTKTKR